MERKIETLIALIIGATLINLFATFVYVRSSHWDLRDIVTDQVYDHARETKELVRDQGNRTRSDLYNQFERTRDACRR